MLRIYLDWNVYSYLKQRKDTEEVYKSLYSIINDNRAELLFPYSPSHLQDLKRSFNKSEKAKLLTYQDIEFLKEVSNSHCLYEGYNEKSVSPQIIDPKEYFEEMLEDKSLENFDFENLLSESADDIKGLWKIYIQLLKALPSGVNFDEIEKLPKKYQKIKDLFQNSRAENSLFALMKDITNVLTSIEQHSDTYKSVRNSSIEDLKIETNPNNWGDPFEYLDQFFKKAKIGKSFEEITLESLKDTEKPKTRFEYFVQYYISLDMFGYHRDAKLPNLLEDATHAYYGAYCDFFLTEDDNTYHKAKAVYEKFGIETIVCKTSEFSSELDKLLHIENHNKLGFLERLSEVMQSSLMIAEGVDEENNKVFLFKIEKYLISYFNRMQITNAAEINTIIFYKRRKNYSTFMFWTELETITNKTIFELGIDENQKFEFNSEDKNEMIENKWSGRVWIKQNILLQLRYLPEPFGLCFQVSMPKQQTQVSAD